MDVSKQLLELRASSGKSQAEIAEIAGVSQRTWSSYESGQSSPKMSVFLNLAAHGLTIDGVTSNLMDGWTTAQKEEYRRRMAILRTGVFPQDMPIDDVAKIVQAVDDHTPKPVCIIKYRYLSIDAKKDIKKEYEAFVVPLLDQKLSAGNGQELPEEDEATAFISIPPFLSKYGNNLAAMTVEGDSMYPTLDRGDIVVCDSGGWSGEGIYAMRMSGDGFVKRLTKAPGKLVIISDNPKYPVREEPEESQDFEIIGRVHCAIKNME